MNLPPIATEYYHNPLQIPHSGYHWDGDSDRFFEGWYFRVTLPEIRKKGWCQVSKKKKREPKLPLGIGFSFC